MLFLRSLPLRARLSAALALVVLTGMLACSWPPSIVVVIPAIPSGATSLSVLVSTGSKQAIENPRYDVSAFVGQAYRFGIHPPLSATGTFSVAVAAYDTAGCLLTTTAGDIELTAADNDGFVYGRPERNLQLSLPPPPADASMNCLKGSPAIRTVMQSEDDPTVLTITGWGFAPGVSVLLDGVAALSATRKDATQIEARVAITPSESGLRQAQVTVKNADGNTAKKDIPLYSVAFAPRDRSTYTFDMAQEPTSVVTGDLNKDGKLDVVVTGLRNTTQGFMAFFVNQGADKFPKEPSFLDFPRTIDDLQLTDMNGDGWLDVVALSVGAQELIVVLNDGAGNFTIASALSVAFPAGSSAITLAVGNILGDSFPDIVVLSNATPGVPGSILFYLGGASGLSYIGSLTLGTVLFGNVTVRDVDNNGRDDLVVAEIIPGVLPNPLLGYVQVFLSNGDGTFGIKPSLPTAAGYYHQVVAMNLDADPLLDLVVSGAFSTSQLPGTTLSVFVNQGSGNFPASRSEFNTSQQPFSMALGDINRDGLTDIALTHTFKEGGGKLSALLNLGGNRGFADVTLQPSFPIGFGDNYVASGDLNSDGKVDFVVINRGALKVKQPALMQLFLNTSL